MFRESFHHVVDTVIIPFNAPREKDGIVSRELWTQAGKQGFLGMAALEEYGGADIRDSSYSINMQEEIIRVHATSVGLGLSLHNDAAKTDPSQGRQGISLLVVKRGMSGFTRGRQLDKIGLKAQDTAELCFERLGRNRRVPACQRNRVFVLL
jgi:alkylation response protein AidB-like acyl-CoA dehydrogenase